MIFLPNISLINTNLVDPESVPSILAPRYRQEVEQVLSNGELGSIDFYGFLGVFWTPGIGERDVRGCVVHGACCKEAADGLCGSVAEYLEESKFVGGGVESRVCKGRGGSHFVGIVGV